MADIKWEKVPSQNEDEIARGVDGVRAVYHGLLLEVRFCGYNDYEDTSAFFSWSVRGRSFSACGRVVVLHDDDTDYSPEERRQELEKQYKLAKRNAESVAVSFVNCESE